MEKRNRKSKAALLAGCLFASLALDLGQGLVWAQSLDKESYSQRLTIQFQNAEAAARAMVEIEPLYDGHYRAVSCRWDDNWTSDNPGTRDLMEEFGIRGTWYLNDREFSPENRPADYLPVAKQLLRGGNSIGGHSLTHPFITYFHSNRMFAEMAGVRIAWEAALDRPVLSYAYSFVDVSPGPEYDQVLQRSLESLTRSGFDHVSEYINFFDDVNMHQELSPIMPPENNPYEEFRSAVEWAYSDGNLTETHPMITNSMHAWYGTPRLNYGYEELRKRFKLLTSLEDVWHCNQNQYAGYRRQFHGASLGRIERQDNTVTFELIRPTILALNDDTPLTLAVSGVPMDTVKSIECRNCEVSISDRRDMNRLRFHVPHRRQDRLPRLIGHIANPKNDPTVENLKPDHDFPMLIGGLYVDGQNLSLSIRPNTDQQLEDVRIAWRVPIGYDVEQNIEHVDLGSEKQLDVISQLIPSQNADLRWGREHFAAQVDFRLDGEPARIHFTCQRRGREPDASMPREGFGILGPVDPKTVGTEDLRRIVQEQWKNEEWGDATWEVPGGNDLAWRTNARDGYVNQAWLNPEYIRTTGTWDAVSPTYVLRSTVLCPTRRKVGLTISHPNDAVVFINGKEIESAEAELNRGENKVLIIYPGATLGIETQRLTACFFRLFDPDTGMRFRDIRYQAF